jgi:hypothetical protein
MESSERIIKVSPNVRCRVCHRTIEEGTEALYHRVHGARHQDNHPDCKATHRKAP